MTSVIYLTVFVTPGTFLMLLQLAPFGLLRAEVGKLVRRTDEHKIGKLYARVSNYTQSFKCSISVHLIPQSK